MNESTLYWCDPDRNTECRKTSCAYLLNPEEGGICAATFRRAFARLDGNGVPMIYDKKERTERTDDQGID